MPFHVPTRNTTLRGLGILALIGLAALVELYRVWLGAMKGVRE